MKGPRRIVWFSCGAASAVTAILVLKEHPNAIVARCVVANEHPDGDRFAGDFEKVINKPIVNLRSVKYDDCWDVWERSKFLNSPKGAKCTTEMKKIVRMDFGLPDDVNYFGFTSDEKKRAERFSRNNFDSMCEFPLIENKLTKQHCFLMLKELGLELPEMYRLGYWNNNCVGCVKGGAGYWNKIRVDFPDIFNRMSDLEERLGRSCMSTGPLRDLHPKAGRHSDLKLPDCGLFCDDYSELEEVK